MSNPSKPSKRYEPPKPAPLPEDYEEFYATLTDAERELDVMAKAILGSSYFIQWSHMYLKWAKTKSEKTKSERTKDERTKDEKTKSEKAKDQEEKKE